MPTVDAPPVPKPAESCGSGGGDGAQRSPVAVREATAGGGCDDKARTATAAGGVPHSPPIVRPPVVHTPTMEEDEDVLWWTELARLYRYETHVAEQFGGGSQWKERGTGAVKLLKHKRSGKTRFLMRRERTLSVCANHYATGCTEPRPHASSMHTFVWVAPADRYGDTCELQVFALRFKTATEAGEFVDHFNKARCPRPPKATADKDEDGRKRVEHITDKLGAVHVRDDSAADTGKAGGDCAKQ